MAIVAINNNAVRYQLTWEQSLYAKSLAKATAFVGGFGSGKTIVDVLKILELKFMYPSVDLLYSAPTYPLIRDIFYPTLEEVCEETAVNFRINRQEHIIHFGKYGKVLCRTLRPEHLIGFKVGAAFLDELDVLKKEIALLCFRKAMARIRQPFPDGRINQVFVSTTPEGYRATHQLFVKDKNPNYGIVHASTHNNPFLPPDYVTTLEDSYPPGLVQAYVHGQFVNLTTGNVYHFDRARDHTDEKKRGNEPLHLGIDFNVGIMFTTVSVLRRKKGTTDRKPCAVGEIVGCLDTPDLIQTIKNQYPGHHITCYPDSTGKNRHSQGASETDIRLLQNAGFLVKPTRNPLIRDRVLAVNVSLKKELLKVNTDLAPALTECLEEQAYDDNGRPDKSSGKDHGSDALGYFIYHNWPAARASAQSIAV